MAQRVAAIGALVALAACLTVPPEQSPPESARKASVQVDHNGMVVEGGNLILNIPPGAIPEGDKVQVEIWVLIGAPPQHLSEAYRVLPDGYRFEEPVTVTYQYKERHVAEVASLDALFVGVAQGHGWQPLDNPSHDLDARRVAGTTTHFSDFGLVDPNAVFDAGVIVDAGTPDAPGADLVRPDTAGRDTSPPDTGATVDGGVDPNALHFQLTWTGAAADLDLHLLRVEGAEFTADDCYYINCMGANGLEWPPTGSEGNPFMDLDDVNGFGPENINFADPADDTYVVAVHAYTLHGDPLPMDFTVRVYQGAALLLDTTRQMEQCDHFHNVADVVVSNGGLTVSAFERSDAPYLAGQASCL